MNEDELRKEFERTNPYIGQTLEKYAISRLEGGRYNFAKVETAWMCFKSGAAWADRRARIECAEICATKCGEDIMIDYYLTGWLTGWRKAFEHLNKTIRATIKEV